ncbi:MAG TPA: agmatine deiminase family protein [Methanotrichaceae archaeon]|nr:agmatine deiminase family protein [Methanotrichaceae archaeon]
MPRVIIGLVQTSVSDDVYRNLQKTIKSVEEAIRKGAKIICLQELYRTAYFPQQEHECSQAKRFAEAIPGESTDVFSKIAKAHGAVIIVPLFERDDSGNLYNSVAVIDADGKVLGTYRKVHIPHDPLFYEKSYFQEGDLGFKVFDTHHGKVAVLICYDQWFPEAARIAALQGAQIIFYPTAIGWINDERNPSEGDWRDAWITVQRGHAIANGVHVAAVNRVGQEGRLSFWGSSFICDSFGKVLDQASDREDDIVVAEADLAKNREVQEGWGFFRNRRPETYGLIVEPKSPCNCQPGCAVPTYQYELKGTPKELGFHMPAEWERHDAIWLSWPYDLDSFPDIGEVERSYALIIKAIHETEAVNLLVTDQHMRSRVRDRLKAAGVDLGKVIFHMVDYADVWFRDYGPTFLVNRAQNKLAMVNWIFNAWGCKYPELMEDTRIPSIINDEMRLPCFLPEIVLEGGSIDVNGKGTVLTTEQCLLNPNRNPGLTKEEIEGYLKEFLGADKVIWLKDGIAGDDTDGHVDDVARFVGSTTVLCAYEDDPNDENYRALKENYEILSASTTQDGNKLNVIKLPMPERVRSGSGKRLPASYANFYIGNGVVMVPTFGRPRDASALKIIQGVFPDRKVVGIRCTEMVNGLGTIHCISQQQPSL